MAAIMASTYKAYLGVGLGPFSFLTNFRIPHPGRVGGRFFIDIAMPLMLSWVLGGNRFDLYNPVFAASYLGSHKSNWCYSSMAE
uniref:Zeaxanthin epoxidaseic n=1 Tax=Rhizophora mucronata TaxID=61149 RepID=A0A2P2MN01_RHIMU